MQKQTELSQIISQMYFIVKCFIKISENNVINILNNMQNSIFACPHSTQLHLMGYM